MPRLLEPSLDFESRSGTDISLGLERYFADPEAAALCLSYDMQDGLGVMNWATDMDAGYLSPIWDYVRRGGVVRAWNVLFEWYCWNTFLVPLGAPPLALSQCVDTMAEAAACNLPQGLDKCGQALRLPTNKLKSKRGKDLIKLLCVPQPEPEVRHPSTYKRQGDYKSALTRHRKWQERGGRWINDPALLQELYDYCDQDVVAEIAIAQKLKRLLPYEAIVWVKTQEMNQLGVPVDVSDIDAITAIVDAERVHLNEELARVTDGALTAASETQALRAWVNERHPQVKSMVRDLSDPDEPVYTEVLIDLLPDLQAETLERVLLEHGASMLPGVRRVIEIRQLVGLTSTQKLHAMRERTASDRTLKNMYVYHGASTGRDSSRGGVNLQNVKSPIEGLDLAVAFSIFATGDHDLARMMYGDLVMIVASCLVRGVIRAPAGHRFIDCDYSSIENRVSAWLAGQDDVVELFRQGVDEYKAFGSLIFNKPAEEITKAERKFSKPGVLGGMFGQGWRGLIDYAAGMGVVLSPADSQRITTLYRKRYDRVKAMWYRMGDVAIQAVRNPGVWFDVGRDEETGWNGTVYPALPFGKVEMLCHKGQFLILKLPSGRTIRWAMPRVEKRMAPWGKEVDSVTCEWQDSTTHQWYRQVLIGSSIFQSAVQAIARDILIHGWLNVIAAGYRVISRTHDELLALMPDGVGSGDEMGRLMCINPPWCPDLPLAFEAWEDTRFRK